MTTPITTAGGRERKYILGVKRCAQCKTEKPLENFHKDRQQKSGLRPYCKSCTTIRAKKSYLKNREQNLKTRRKYLQENKKKILMARKIYYEAHKEEIFKKRYEDIKKPELKIKISARHAIYRAVRSGKIIKPSKCGISGCKNREIQAHHFNGYAKENHFDISWLCRKHHMEAHKI